MMYQKNGKISACRVIYSESRQCWISNPTHDTIIAEGWEEYIPPVVETPNIPEDELGK